MCEIGAEGIRRDLRRLDRVAGLQSSMLQVVVEMWACWMRADSCNGRSQLSLLEVPDLLVC